MAQSMATKASKESSLGQSRGRSPGQPVFSGLSGAEAEMMALQQSVGNRAVGQLLAAGGEVAAKNGIPPMVQSVIDSGSGRPLEPEVRAEMESRFQQDFSQVRIHTDAKAAESAQAVDALAYTFGNKVVFNAGKFSPSSTSGRQLLAHELAHVVQQNSFSNRGSLMPNYSLEAEADRAAMNINQGNQEVDVSSGVSGLQLLCQPADNRRAKVAARSNPFKVMLSANEIAVEVEGQPLVTATFSSEQKPRYGIEETSDGSQQLFITFPPAGGGHATSYAVNENILSQIRARGYSFQTADPHRDENNEDVLVSGFTIAITSPKPKPPNQAVQTNTPKAQPSKPPKPPNPVETLDQPSANDEEQIGKLSNLPPKAPETLIDENTELFNLDEDKLGGTLLNYARSQQFSLVDSTLEKLGSTDRDDVSLAFTSQASNKDLQKMAETPEGRKLLDRLYDELTSGHASEEELKQAERILLAKSQRIDPQKFIEADQKAPVIPFSRIGFTKLSSASLSVHRLPNGKIWVRSHMKTEHWKNAKRLPSAGFAAGLGAEFDPDDVVGLYLYDEGGTIIYVPTLYLLQLSNQEDSHAHQMMGEAFITGLTLGFGGGAAAGAGEASTGVWAARGLTTLKWADRVATAVGIASTLINDHRGLIIKHFGKDGEAFLKHWATVEQVVAIYGLARGAVALGQTVNSLRTSYRNWRTAQAQLKNLSSEEKQTLDQIASQTEKSLQELEQAQVTANKGIASPQGESTSSAASGKPIHPDKPTTAPSSPEPKSSDLSQPKGAGQEASNVASLEARRKKLIASQSRARRSSNQRKLASGDRETTVASSADDDIQGFSLEEGHPISAEDNLEIRKTRTVRTTEYDPKVGDSGILGKRLKAVGREKPGDGYEAHHIIPSNEEQAARLRKFLEDKGVDINHPDNGVWLSRGSQTGNVGAEYKHEFTFQDHPEYFKRLEEIFLKNPKISKQQIYSKLRKIGEYLEAGKLPPSNL